MFIIREDAQVQFGQFPQIQKEGNETRRGEARRLHTSQDARSSLFLALRTEIKRQRPGFVFGWSRLRSSPRLPVPCLSPWPASQTLSPPSLSQHLCGMHDTTPTRIATEIKIKIGARHAAKTRPCCTRSKAVSGAQRC